MEQYKEIVVKTLAIRIAQLETYAEQITAENEQLKQEVATLQTTPVVSE